MHPKITNKIWADSNFIELDDKGKLAVFWLITNANYAGYVEVTEKRLKRDLEVDINILDEATSSVDSVTENLIQKAISRIFQDKTVIAIAHRLSTIRNSDLILVMDAGKIVERGSHKKLIAHNGVYAGLIETLSGESELPKLTLR